MDGMAFLIVIALGITMVGFMAWCAMPAGNSPAKAAKKERKDAMSAFGEKISGKRFGFVLKTKQRNSLTEAAFQSIERGFKKFLSEAGEAVDFSSAKSLPEMRDADYVLSVNIHVKAQSYAVCIALLVGGKNCFETKAVELAPETINNLLPQAIQKHFFEVIGNIANYG